MSWAGLANNQAVSNANLDNAISTSVFVKRENFTANNLELTKSRAQSYVYLDENYSSFYNKVLNQLITKQDLQPATIINCGSGTYGNILWTANSNVITTAFFDVGTTSGILNIEYVVNNGSASLSVVYGNTSSSITGIVNTNGSTTYSYTYNASFGTIIGITFETRQNTSVLQDFNVRTTCSCNCQLYDIWYDGSDCSSACNSPTGGPYNVYTCGGTLDLNKAVYSNSSCSIPLADGIYSNGGQCYTITSGVLSSYSDCCPPYGTLISVGCEIGPDCLDTQEKNYYADGNCGVAYTTWGACC